MLRKSCKIASLLTELKKNLGIEEFNISLDFIREEQKKKNQIITLMVIYTRLINSHITLNICIH